MAKITATIEVSLDESDLPYFMREIEGIADKINETAHVSSITIKGMPKTFKVYDGGDLT